VSAFMIENRSLTFEMVDCSTPRQQLDLPMFFTSKLRCSMGINMDTRNLPLFHSWSEISFRYSFNIKFDVIFLYNKHVFYVIFMSNLLIKIFMCTLPAIFLSYSCLCETLHSLLVTQRTIL
jgi:hypothetical protein